MKAAGYVNHFFVETSCQENLILTNQTVLLLKEPFRRMLFWVLVWQLAKQSKAKLGKVGATWRHHSHLPVAGGQLQLGVIGGRRPIRNTSGNWITTCGHPITTWTTPAGQE